MITAKTTKDKAVVEFINNKTSKKEKIECDKVLIADNYWDPERMKVIENKKYVYQNVPATDDPDVVRDEAQRDAAQATIDKTPQSIIDSINT